MIRWYPIFQRHITEHPRLQLLIVSSHSCFLSHRNRGLAVFFQQPPRHGPLSSSIRLTVGQRYQPRSESATVSRAASFCKVRNLCEVYADTVQLQLTPRRWYPGALANPKLRESDPRLCSPSAERSHKESIGEPSPGEYEVLLAIVSASKKDLTIPFLNRVNLNNTWIRLEELGYKVSLAKIQAQPSMLTV